MDLSSQSDYFSRGEPTAPSSHFCLKIAAQSAQAQRLRDLLKVSNPTFVSLADTTAVATSPASEAALSSFLQSASAYGVGAAPSQVKQVFLEDDDVFYDCEEAPTETYYNLSVRLLHAQAVQGTFKSTDCLSDVKRWLSKEGHILADPDMDEITRYVHIGQVQPSRIAFFFPATRTTFTEAQELVRLLDLGLSHRLALILRPDYDKSVFENRGHSDPGMLKETLTKLAKGVRLLYDFFDYGLHDAHKEPVLEDYSFVAPLPPPFLGAQSIPSASVLSMSTVVPEADVGDEKPPASDTVVQTMREEV